MTTFGCQCSDSNHKRIKKASDRSFGENLIESECNELAASCEMHLVLQHASGKLEGGAAIFSCPAEAHQSLLRKIYWHALSHAAVVCDLASQFTQATCFSPPRLSRHPLLRSGASSAFAFFVSEMPSPLVLQPPPLSLQHPKLTTLR